MIPMTLQIWIYRSAVRLYPSEFRREYGDDLVQLFTELVSDLGPRRAWGRTVVDLIATLPRYRLETLVNLSRSSAPMVGAAAAAILSLVWLALAVADLSGGLGETLRHWWSTLPAVALTLSVAALLIIGRRRRPSSPDHRLSTGRR